MLGRIVGGENDTDRVMWCAHTVKMCVVNAHCIQIIHTNAKGSNQTAYVYYTLGRSAVAPLARNWKLCVPKIKPFMLMNTQTQAHTTQIGRLCFHYV